MCVLLMAGEYRLSCKDDYVLCNAFLLKSVQSFLIRIFCNLCSIVFVLLKHIPRKNWVKTSRTTVIVTISDKLKVLPKGKHKENWGI